MSLDKLAVIFIIIILPISLALNVYTDYQSKTLNLQASYDAKLNTATSDALKAYQLNAFNESTSNLSVSKMRDIKAAANTFLNSISTNFNMVGFSKDSIQNYIPALVFTMYDGFYIYSKFDNTLTENEYKERHYDAASGTYIEESTYKNGQELYGLKPFISYSCRYQRGEEDFVISYSLDNYISIQGKVKVGSEIKWINDAGYLIDISKIQYNPQNSYIIYRERTITKEDIQWETVGKDRYRYKKINGVKYYYDENHVNSRGDSDPKWFSLLNGDKNYINAKYNLKGDYSAYNYYKDAYDFTKRVRDTYGLANLKPTDAYGIVEEKQEDGSFTQKRVSLVNELNQAESNVSIFGSDFAKGIEEPTSNFNEHRLAVIKYVIQRDLSIAIKNYNKYSPVGADFQMPKLEESEWDKILNNITLISFLQGLPIGGKIYNGCSVVANNKNDEVVTEKSIYIGVNDGGTEDNYYYSPLYKSFPSGEEVVLTGIFNVDLERRSIESGDASIEPDNYYPKYYLAAYDSIVSPTGNANISAEKTDIANGLFAYNDNIYTYMDKNANEKVATTYYTALGRERNSTYKINAPYKIPAEAKIYSNNSHKYLLYDTSTLKTFNNDVVTWDNAEAYCESLGGHLVTINSSAEKEFLEDNFGIDDDDTPIEYWIGKKDNQLITKELNEITDVYSGRQCYDGTLRYFICEWE